MVSNDTCVHGMTGFGRGSSEMEGRRCEVEIKGVNHRFLDIKLRLPAEMNHLEPDLRARVKERVGRGRVDVSASMATDRKPLYTVEVRSEFVAQYLGAARALKKEFRLPGTISLAQVVALPGAVAITPVATEEDESGSALLRQAFDAALEEFVTMRRSEGARLAEEVRLRLSEIEASIGLIEEGTRAVPETYAERLRSRVAAVAAERGVDELRLAQEIAYLAERVDIREEIVRLTGYVEQARGALAAPAGAVGKTLDFVMQEMNREATTIASKAEALAICQAALAIRSAVEKIREQVQNIE